jgi:aminopeptidase N
MGIRWLALAGIIVGAAGALAQSATAGSAQGSQPSAQKAVTTPGRTRPPDVLKPPTKDDLLRGGYGPYRANNDLLYYRLNLKVDPVAKSIAGSNLVRFRMLQDGQRIQMELAPELTLDEIVFDGRVLTYDREERTLYIDFPRTLRKGELIEMTIVYHGQPVTQGRFGCFSFDKDKEGKPWITTACEGEGPSVWWPNKDQWQDEPQEGMEIDISVPDGLMDVSNGHFAGTRPMPDNYTEWRWLVSYPINNYDVALNIGDYKTWHETHTNKETGETTPMDFYALPQDLDKAKVQFEQAQGMMDAYEHYFGEYPFDKDGYKLVEVPYAGMEHQSAVAYGNHFENGYYGRDWTGVGISPKFDFIIIHESGHEWFGNAITAKDRSDMWIHEGWTTYLEVLYVEYRWGKADAIKYVNGLKPKVQNERPIITPRGTNAEPPQDQYFKGALMLNTLRSVIDDDTKWFADIKAFYNNFKYQTIMTEDVVGWWNARTGMDLTPFFNQYLRHKDIPTLLVSWNPKRGTIVYRWKADEAGFAIPIKVGDPQHWTLISPSTTESKSMKWSGTLEDFKVATDLYYVNVDKGEIQE